MLYPDGGRVTYGYDPVGQQIEVGDATGLRAFDYAPTGQNTAVRHLTVGWALTYAYDAVGNRAWMDAPDGRTSYAYDGQNACVEVWNPYNERTTWQYDALGREQRKTYANGMVASHTYDAAGRETLLENRQADGLGLAIYSATYDAMRNRLTVLELDGTQVTYAYDESYQLIREHRSGAYAYDTTYIYDGNGNRLQKIDSRAVTTYQYNGADELLQVTPLIGQPTTSVWDTGGNLATEYNGDEILTYTWDYENRLSQSNPSDGAIESYAYYESGLRYRKTTSVETVLFVWDRQNLLLESMPNGGLRARFTDYPGYWGGLASQHLTGLSSLFCFDMQQDTRVVVSQFGDSLAAIAYSAFGVEIGAMGSANTPFRFCGRQGYFSESRVIYVRARNLDTRVARWISRDPFRDYPSLFATGLIPPYDNLSSRSLYVYVENRPFVYTDPTGLIKFSGCSIFEQRTIQNAFDILCSRRSSLDSCYEQSCSQQGGMGTSSCFEDTCSDPLVTVTCVSDQSGRCDAPHYKKKKPCASAAPNSSEIQICDRFFDPTVCTQAAHCILGHEFIHHCGTIGHKNKSCFNCVKKCFPSCPAV